MKVLAVGGGSGGHVTPVVAVLNQLHKRDPSLEARFVCDRSFAVQSRGLMKQLPFAVPVEVIAAGKFRRYSHLTLLQHFTVPSVVWGNLRDIARVIYGFLQSVGLLIRHRPDVVFAKGGYVCLPLGIAAWLLRIPLVIHDSDTRPGLTNRILARVASGIATGAPLDNYPYDRRKARYTGVPIGHEFAPVTSQRQVELKAALGVDADALLVVATGGGLGSLLINNAVIAAARQFPALQYYVVAGKKQYAAAKAEAEALHNVHVVDFIYDGMAQVLGAADIVVARGSATFLQELAGLAKPTIIIPAHQLGDQRKNAALYERHDAAVVISDEQVADGALEVTLQDLVDDTTRRRELAQRLHSFARPDAARDVATCIIDAIGVTV